MSIRLASFALFTLAFFAGSSLFAQSAGPLVKLLASGKLPPERQATVVEMICKRGDAADLQVVLDRVLDKQGFAGPLQAKALAWLSEATATRKVVPAGDLSRLKTLIASPDAAVRQAALKAAADWKVAALAPELRLLAEKETTEHGLRVVAIAGLAQLGDASSKAALLALAKEVKPISLRLVAATALVESDFAAGSGPAVAVLKVAATEDDIGPLLDAVLARKQGTETLAELLKAAPVSADMAKRVLRHLYGAGRSDAALIDLMSEQAGLSSEITKPTPDEIQKLVKEVLASGDAARGEKIFRRADLGCFNCHSLNRAGGQVGPDLTAVGSISPPDYVATSILDPSASIKEQFLTRMLITTAGKTYTGIVAERDDTKIVLREATGKSITIPVADIEEEAEGKSLMPQGITRFLTRSELVDLIRFVGELGKPGPYALRTTPVVARWRVMEKVPAEIAAETPNIDQARQYFLEPAADAFRSVYATVSGDLPLAELKQAKNGATYLLGEFQVTVAGAVELAIQAPPKTEVYLDAIPSGPVAKASGELTAGRHRVVLRVPAGSGASDSIRVELRRPAGSKAQFDPIGGP